ncbi:hypothetical protein G9C98_006165 [Cotesia typhae]|uniref:Ig-like domain-containing protein n=1 Tax=Cotesia typhae TaxID=2053667 RepID=A0A8J5RFB2_9HYME|nr:hypothetical protein G9C98_006165 [Cotesia typhae]
MRCKETGKNPSILHPVIRQITHLPVLGGDLRLNCSVEIDRDLTFSHDWKTPYAFTTEDTRLQITSNRIKLGDNQYKAVKDLLITDITSEDEGEYTCTIQTHSKAYSVKLNVQFHDPNIKYLNVFLHSNETSFTRNEGDDIKWVIDFDGYPLPTVRWIGPSDQDIINSSDGKYSIENTEKKTVLILRSMGLKDMGTYTFRISNSDEFQDRNLTLIVQEVSGGFGIIETPKDVIIGDNITLTCGASIYNFTSNINWFDEDDNQINQTNRLIIDKTFDEYTFYTHLKVINVSKLDNVLYKCKGLLNSAQELQDYRRIEVNDPLEPYILKSSMNQTENIYTTDEAAEITIELKCDIEGMPTPVISWWKVHAVCGLTKTWVVFFLFNRIKYAALSFSRSISTSSSNGPKLISYTPGNDTESINMSPEGPILSNNSVQPSWRSNYRGDYKDYNLKPICTQDLLSWAFQVARGMEYLSQRKHYVDLNTPYIDMNTAFFENRQNDYLMMISSPDHEALSSPHEYVNSPIPLSPASDTSYICMSPTQERDESGIFSPLSLSEKSHFDFPSENKSSCNSHNINSDSDSEIVEISPMLKSEDDNYLKPINIQERRAEFARQRQAIKNSIAKDKAIERDSGYCNALQNFRLIDKTQVHCKDDTDDGGGNKKLNNKNNFNNYKDGIIRTQDNYVNIPSYNNEMRKDIPDSFTNPSYVFMTNDKDQTKA